MKMRIAFIVKITFMIKSFQFMIMLLVFFKKKSNFIKFFSLCKLRNYININ